MALTQREIDILRLVDAHTIHGVLHGLVEVCHHKRAAAERSDHPDESASWGQICRSLTSVEEMAARLEGLPRARRA
jgi:hypothetical protein